MRKHFKYGFMGLTALVAVACNDYLDVNENVNAPSANSINAAQMLAGVQTSAFEIQSINMNQLGNVYMGAWASNVLAFTGGYANEYQLNVDSNFQGGIWNSLYRNIGQFQNVINKTKNDKTFETHGAIAQILKTHYMQYIVDLYGDAPYSDAFKGQEQIFGKYDDDKQIYRNLIIELDNAISKLEHPHGSASLVTGKEDVMLGGDKISWVKLANTIKLRLLVRQSKLAEKDAETNTYLQAEIGKLVGKNFVDFNVKVNPGYNSSTDDQQNPFYNTYGYDTNGGNNYSFNRASRQLADHLMGVSTITGTSDANTGVKDPRRTYIYRAPSGNIASNIQGGTVGVNLEIPQVYDSGTEKFVSGASRMSAFLIPNNVNTGLTNIAQDKLDAGSSQNGYLMLKAEADFLLAEAALIFPGKFGDAQTHFNNGITSSFNFYGISSQASEYIAATDSKNGFGWTGSADKFYAICTQRWIALTNIHAIETFINYNKYGYPKVPLARGAVKPNRPYRLHYPASEYAANSTNVPKLTQDDIFNKGTKSPFWLNF
ncbi:SusD/RagB family nutrient-binding outer membrane lipoprotein [Flavobacterium davisii]|nr:SusD/RagB family nutrient-binding outer membrane lipoprotein [Flavobacterium davisii]